MTKSDHRWARFAAALALTATTSAAARADTLADAITQAYDTNPQLQSQRTQLRVTDETYVQARAGYRPTVNIQVQASRSDYLHNTTNAGTAAVILTQPIYTGGRTAAAVSGAEADILTGRENLRQVEANVLQTVIQAYVDVRRDQQSVVIQQENLDALQRDLDETRARAGAGELTRTDVAQSQAGLAQARIQLANAQAQLAVSRAAYLASVGKTPGDLEPEPALPGLPATIDEAFATAQAGNANLRAAYYAEQAARARTAEARDQRMPSVSLKAQLGYTGPRSQFQPDYYDRNAVATVTVTQPLFAGGVIDSQVRQQLEKENLARIQTEQFRRAMMQSLAESWSQLLAARANIANAQEQVSASRVALEGMQQERKLDLRSTLEILSIQQTLSNAQLALVGARRDEYLSGAAVLNAMGTLQAKTLVASINSYDPARSFRRVRNSGFLPWEPAAAAIDHLTAPPLRRLPPPPSAPIATAPNARP